MKYSMLILCLLISSPVFAKDEPVNLKSISQMGADMEPCLHQPAFAGTRQTERALRQKEPQISEGGREVQNLSDQIIDSLGLRPFVE